MKLASFAARGAESYGLVVEDGLVDLRARLPACPTLRAALAADALGEIAGARGAKPDLALTN